MNFKSNCACFGITFISVWAACSAPIIAASVELAPVDLNSSLEGKGVLASWAGSSFKFAPEVRKSYLAFAKATALKQVAASGKTIPADFLAWIDSDPVVEATVYGARHNAANVLLMLRSLELDLGTDVVRKDYTQLALAMAVVHAAKGPEADLSPRGLVKIVIPGDPREPVDTRDPNRKLDRNDHIINFLNSNNIQEQVVVGSRMEPPPLKYDDKGIAIPPGKDAKQVKVPVTETRTRTLYAADVMASRELQQKFNAYMKEHGEEVSIDCGDQIISWNSKNAVKAERKTIAEAFVMFRTAYEMKGLLPKARDASPSPAESTAWLIRNDKYRFPAETANERNWPRYPLTAPWPTLTLLAADDQPLREREERWIAFRDKGETRTYGEYIGGIAQQFDMQSARRLSPYPFHYGTYQMMAKDGGVCGTMANMGVRTYNTLGIPSCTAGQPGHCALILFAFDLKANTYECRGGQFATGGPDKTSPHTPWVFGDVDARKPMIYYQSIAWAVNHGMRSYLDSTLAYQMFRQLPQRDRLAHGQELLESGLALNPYNFLLADAGMDLATTPQAQVRFWKALKNDLQAVETHGSPKDGLYNLTIKSAMFAKLAKLPVPEDMTVARAVLAFLREEDCDNQDVLAVYQISIGGLETVVGQTRDAFAKHLSSVRTDESCATMAATLTAVASRIPDTKIREKWVMERWREIKGHGSYLGKKDKITIDACATALAKLGRQKLPPEVELIQPVLDELVRNLAERIKTGREPKDCIAFEKRMVAVNAQIKEPAQSAAWLQSLSRTIAGHENYQGAKGRKLTDVCAVTITRLLAESSAGDEK